MAPDPADVKRRIILQATAGLAMASSVGSSPAHARALKPAANGKAGDFAFLTGEWTIKNRQMQDGAWVNFDGEATVTSILAGLVSIEELRIPQKKFSGMGLRMLDVEQKLWADYWVNSKTGVLTPPPAWGSFVNGVGTWDSDDEDAGKPIIVRGVWDRTTSSSCRWYQAVSRDDGKNWQENWVMDWTRVSRVSSKGTT